MDSSEEIEIINIKITGIMHISASTANMILKHMSVFFAIRFSLFGASGSSLLFAIFLPPYIIALSSSILRTIPFATRMVIQQATDWKNVTADVMPIGVDERMALNT